MSKRPLSAANLTLSAANFVNVCSQAASVPSEYCEGYIDGASLYLRMRSACSTLAPAARSFCAGFEAAMQQEGDLMNALPQSAIQSAMETEIRKGAVRCVPDKEHDRHYCDGFNSFWSAVLASWSSKLAFRSSSSPSEKQLLGGMKGSVSRVLGLAGGWNDAVLHLFGSPEFGARRVRVPFDLGADAMRGIVLSFATSHRNQQQGHKLTAVILIERALYYAYNVEGGQDLQPHMEACLAWDTYGGRWGARNDCAAPVVIVFMTRRDKTPVKEEVAPGGIFRSHLSAKEIAKIGWIFTACPVGYLSSTTVTPQNWRALGASLYDCKRP